LLQISLGFEEESLETVAAAFLQARLSINSVKAMNENRYKKLTKTFHEYF